MTAPDRADLPAGWLHGPTGDDGKPIVLATPRASAEGHDPRYMVEGEYPTDRASAEGHRYDHDGMHRHHHEYGPTGRAIWWEYADQFGGDLTEHTHADRASAEGLVSDHHAESPHWHDPDGVTLHYPSDRIENGWSEYDAPPPGDSDR